MLSFKYIVRVCMFVCVLCVCGLVRSSACGGLLWFWRFCWRCWG